MVLMHANTPCIALLTVPVTFVIDACCLCNDGWPVLLCWCLQDVFCYENVQELGQQAGIITADRPVLCKPSKHVSAISTSSRSGLSCLGWLRACCSY
jgi:hypothetical protein